MAKKMKKSAKGTTKGGSESQKIANLKHALQEAVENLCLANTVIAERDGAIAQMIDGHGREMGDLLLLNKHLHIHFENAIARVGELRVCLEAEELHDREQELNISVLLQQIMLLNRQISQLEQQLLGRRQAEAR